MHLACAHPEVPLTVVKMLVTKGAKIDVPAMVSQTLILKYNDELTQICRIIALRFMWLAVIMHG